MLFIYTCYIFALPKSLEKHSVVNKFLHLIFLYITLDKLDVGFGVLFRINVSNVDNAGQVCVYIYFDVDNFLHMNLFSLKCKMCYQTSYQQFLKYNFYKYATR